MRLGVPILIALLVLADLAWNLSHFNSGLVDVFGLLGFARSFVECQAWPATPYFPAGYPLLLIAGAQLGNALAGGYVLSTGGLALALWALYRLVRELGGDRWLGLAAIGLGWLMPTYRVIAGSPSVDPLYTGLALWFIAASVALWRFAAADQPGFKINQLPPWAGWGLTLPVLALPLIRYHAVLLILPVLAILTSARPQLRRFILWPWLALIGVTAFNYASYYAAYHELLPSAAGIQIRCGLEFRYSLFYASHDDLFRDYPAFCDHARSSSIVADYGWPRLLEHTLKDWYYFLRRPPVVLALALTLALGFRRRLPAGAALLALWIPAYCLVLSPSYYTARAAALPALAALGLALVLAGLVLSGRRAWLGVLIASVLLLAGGWRASNYAQAIYAERVRYARYSREIDRVVTEQDWHWTAVATNDMRIIPLSNNPWALPYPYIGTTWFDDPAIRQPLIGLRAINEQDLSAPTLDLQLQGLIIVDSQPDAQALKSLIETGPWEPCYTAGELTVLRYVRATNPDGA
ncbi:hypothetical protein JW859_05150 [bacterium]|nr:hypothetical protein [bacterium]